MKVYELVHQKLLEEAQHRLVNLDDESDYLLGLIKTKHGASPNYELKDGEMLSIMIGYTVVINVKR